MILKKRMNSSFFQIILVQFILFFKSSYCKMASGIRNSINSVPQTAGTTVAFSDFSSVFFLLLWSKPRDRFVWRTTDLEMRLEREKVRTYRTPKIARTHRLILCHGSVINWYFYALSYGMFYFWYFGSVSPSSYLLLCYSLNYFNSMMCSIDSIFSLNYYIFDSAPQ